MENKQLVSVRSNCTFALDYNSGKLHPQTEVIIITQSPNYVVRKDKIVRELKADEFRFRSTLEGINALIGELQVLVQNMNNFEQTAGAFNVIIESARQRQEEIDKQKDNGK